MESIATAHRDLRTSIRSLEKILSFACKQEIHHEEIHSGADEKPKGSSATSGTVEFITSSSGMTRMELGHMMCVVYRLQNTLVLHHSHFDGSTLAQVNE